MSQSNTSSIPAQDDSAPVPDVSVVIVSWNVRDLLVTCLSALEAPDVREDLTLEIIVVDNASSDGSAQAAREMPGVCVIETGANLGYGRANNLGFEEARGRCLLVLNPDTVPQPGSLKTLVRFAGATPRAGIAAPRLLNPDGSVQESAFRFPTLLMAFLDLFPLPRFIPGRIRAGIYRVRLNGRYPREERAGEPFPIDHPLGACMLLRREAYEQVGGFDPALQMYSEEVDLALRLAETGWERWQVPASRVLHYGGQSTRQVPDRMFVELWRSRLYIYRKHYTRISFLALYALLAGSQLGETVKALVGLETGRIGRTEARRRWRRAGALLRLGRTP